MLPNGVKEILDHDLWTTAEGQENAYPLYAKQTYLESKNRHRSLNFLQLHIHDWDAGLAQAVKADSTCVLVMKTDNSHAMPELRRFFFKLIIRRNSKLQ